MVNVRPEGLRRFWFPTATGFGFGVTARTRDEAEAMARQAAAQLRRAFEPLKVVEDVDVRTLDQALSNKRLKLPARVDCGMNLSSARRSLSAIR